MGNPERAKPDPLFGRARELALIQTFIEESVRDGAALLLSGDPGVGKTALLGVAANSASVAGSRVVRAAGVEFEADLAFGALHQLLLPLHDEFRGLTGIHREALNAALGFGEGTAPNRLLISNAALTALRLSAATRPLLIIIDDAQWLDRMSAEALAFVARRLTGSRIGVLAAVRPGEGGFFESAELPELELEPLDEEAADGLLRVRFPNLASAGRRRVLEEAHGNSLALLELPVTLGRSDGTASPGSRPVIPMTRRLQELFASRIARLPAAARQLLLRAALDGTGDLRILSRHKNDDRGLADLDALERARLLQLDAITHRLTFYHPLIRSAVVELSTAEERRGAHQELAEIFAAQPDRHAWHLAQASLAPDEEVAALLEEAAHRILRRGDPAGAIAALSRASELSPADSDRSRRLAAAAYIGAEVTGELRGASQLLTASRAIAQGSQSSLRAVITASHLLLNGDGDVDTAHRLLMCAVDDPAAAESGDSTLGEALYTLMMVCFFGGRAALWEPLHAAIARVEADLPATVSLTEKTIGDPARTAAGALRELDAAIEALAEESDPTWIIRIALAGAFLDRLPACRAALSRVVEDSRQGGAVASGLNAQMLLARDGFWTGQWDHAQRLVDEAVECCQEAGYVLLAWPGRHTQALIAAARGEYHVAEGIAAEMAQWAALRGVRLLQWYACQVRGLAALGRRDFEAAYRHASTISPAGTLASHNLYAVLAQMDLVEAAVRTSRRAEAAAHVAAIREADIAALSSRLGLLAGASAALAAPDEEAPRRFEEALAIPGVETWSFDHARVRLLYGEHLRRIRAITESRGHLRAALETFERLDARPWVQRAANELRATGETRPRAHERDQDALTPQELKIAHLAASGLTNKQIGARLFLSHRTVGFHLHRVFPKLGITSRAALRDALDTIPSDPYRPVE